jgi:hypothetical protein
MVAEPRPVLRLPLGINILKKLGANDGVRKKSEGICYR